MSSSLYRSFLRLLEKWPADPWKTGKDLGEYIRGGVGASFRGGAGEPRDSQKCEEIQARLSNICSNRYKDAFYVSDSDIKSASGLSKADCREAISNEFLKLLEQENRTARQKITSYFKSKKEEKVEK